ncbi:DEAD-box ATP-dependent RNA helicase 50 isoform X2 [Solanum lycopersicum]|uniref:DEAD-box ATP-dependent RNA helicase 50 isoform X2 n=1 Tax=Solanum lycopersicum TaxID=4081 RepID=UPI003748A8C8
MLAAPRPPALTVGCFKFQNPSANVNLVQRNVGSSNCKRVVVAAKATYSRVPLDTPGAYQLIDEDTGEKFIVWGSAEDDSSNSPIPSNEVLSWKPLPSPNNNNNDNDSTINQGNFGRLKFRRMRDLVRKSYTKNKKRDVIEHDEHNVTNTSSQSSTSSYGELDQLKEKQKLSARALAKIQQLESRKNSPKIIRMEDEGYNGDFDAEFGRLVDSRSKASASSLRGWGRGQSIHDRSMGEEISRRRQNLDDRNNFFSRKSFHDMGCSDYMIEALRNQHFVRPSHIQSLTFEPIMAGKSCIVSDQSGSGKTLAYLLPLIQRLRQEELQGLSKPSPQSPRVVILAPTTELASQVLNTCRSFSKSGVPFRSMVVTGGFRQRTQLENLRQELDVLIATPGRFMFLIKEGYLQLTNLKCAVLDEVDILFNDEDFETAFQCLINSSPIITQYLFVTATLPMDIYNKLVESFPDCELVTGPGMHRTSPGLEETTSQERDMMKHLLAMMTNLCKKVEKIETEVQNLKANSQQHDSKHAELGQQHDQKHAKLQGDVGKLQKTHNNICSNAATASTSTAGQSAKKEEAKVLVDCSGDETAEKSPDTAFHNKKNALLQLVERSPVPKTIVFCNKIDSCRKVENALKRFDRKGFVIKVLPFHAALDQESRLANMKEFRSSKAENVSLFLVCTDRASRGIDFEGVDHVVLFDYPRDPSEYVRRVGRTARGAGGKGKAFIFAVGKQVSLARRIMERNSKGHPLHDVPSMLT